jgi:hypothetical protein
MIRKTIATGGALAMFMRNRKGAEHANSAISHTST